MAFTWAVLGSTVKSLLLLVTYDNLVFHSLCSLGRLLCITYHSSACQPSFFASHASQHPLLHSQLSFWWVVYSAMGFLHPCCGSMWHAFVVWSVWRLEMVNVNEYWLTSVKAPLRSARDLSWDIILNLSFRIGTMAIVIWASTTSPTLNWVGSASENLINGVIIIYYLLFEHSFEHSYLDGPPSTLSCSP